MAVGRKIEISENLKLHSNDTGSSSVQVAILSAEITQLTQHLNVNKKDYSSRRSLLKKVAARKIHLKYLKRRDEDKYRLVITTLGLKR
jgi:small subunit ribosomal protein S15